MRAYVVFSEECQHWAARFLPGRFGHVSALIYDEATNIWLGLNFDRTGHRLSVFASGDVDVRRHVERQGMTVVAIDVDRDALHSRGPLIMNNCVGMTKAVCGLRSWAVTPTQLYHHCCRRSVGDHQCADFSLT